MIGKPFPKGHIPWNKGKSHLVGKNHPMYGKHHTEESNQKNRIAHLGNKHSENTKRKISNSNKGRITWNKGGTSWNKGLTKETDERVKKLGLNSGKVRKGNHYPNKNHFKKGKKFSKEELKKILRRRNPSSLEIKFDDIIKRNKLPYTFVGNGEFFIERKNPDFINCNGQKIAIEVFYKKHKETFRNSLKEWRIERQNIFNKYGWRIEFFDETQVNEKEILRRIG